MIKISLLTTCIILSGLLFPVQGEVISLEDLTKEASLYDGKKVEVKGEILDILEKQNGAWLNIIDDSASIGVWVKDKEIIPPIEYFGSYKERGAILKIEGVFYKSCKEHFGQTDVHALDINVLEKGKEVKKEVLQFKVDRVIGWGLICLFLLAIYIGKTLKIKKKASSKSKE